LLAPAAGRDSSNRARFAFGRDAGGDIDADGDTDLEDLSLPLSDFGTACP